MASNSKKRRRVLRVSCILAALIIAGSSFAWFTSSDEVTNRLSANADYDVRLVESFAPPANWLPGETVNKDVYATNTGNIGAFVKEEVSGVMTVTTEKSTPTKTTNSLKLTQEERYAVEAGSFLAYKPSTSAKKLGDVAVVRPADAGDPKTTDFTPDVEGLYVFRRSMDVAVDSKEESNWVYDGYYFDGTDYYKISELSVVQDSTVDKADDGIKTDGNLASAAAGFVEREQKVLDPTNLVYNGNVTGVTGVPDGKYLIASYDTGNTAKSTKLAVLAKAYDDAIHNYEYAKALNDAAAKEATDAGSGTGGALATAQTNFNDASSALDDANADLATKLAEYNNALIAYNNAVDEYNDAKRDYEASMVKLFGNAAGGITAAASDNTNGEANNYTTGSYYGKKVAADAAVTAMGAYSDDQAFVNEYNSYAGTSYADIAEFNSKVADNTITVANLEAFKTAMEGGTPSEAHTYYAKRAAQIIADHNFQTEFTKCFGTPTDWTTANLTAKMTTPADGSYEKRFTTANTNKATATSNLGTRSDPTASPAVAATGAAGALEEAENTQKNAQTEYTNKYNALVAAQNTNKEKADKATQANKLYTDASAALTAARDAYVHATDSNNADYIDLTTDGVLKIYIKLSDKVTDAAYATNDMWYLSPSPIVDDTAVFYYTGILEGGETSSKLIDSVLLDPAATADMYKSFDFDLNVALKSAQIVNKEDGTIGADATPVELGKIATLTTPSDINTTVQWSDSQSVPPSPNDAANTHYTATISGTANATITKLANAVSDGTNTYQYVYNDGTYDYYGNALTNGTVFTQGTVSGTAFTPSDPATTKTLETDAVKQ